MEPKVLTAEELFLRGKVQVKKNPLLFWRDNPFGKELDLSERRPVVNLAGTIFEQKYGRPHSKLFANLYHRGKFYIARVPNNGVKDFYFQLWYFKPKIGRAYLAAHALLRFEMNPQSPIELVAEVPTEETLKALAKMPGSAAVDALPGEIQGASLKNVAVSAEAQWTKDDKYKEYNLWRGKIGAFTQIGRFVSMEERLVKYYQSDEPVDQVEFESSGDAASRALDKALAMSQSDGISKRYDTLFYNCTTYAFDVLEKADGFSDDRLGFIRSFAEKRVPVISASKLKYYGGLEVKPVGEDASLNEEKEAAKTRVAEMAATSNSPAGSNLRQASHP